MRLKKKVDLLIEKLDVLIVEGNVRDLLERQVAILTEQNQKLFDRLMARNFETLQTYTAWSGEEKEVGKDVPLEENPDMAGEVLEVGEN